MLDDDSGIGYYSELSQKYFSTWRNYRLASGCCGALALIPALIDYEKTYTISRSMETCMQVDAGTAWLRIIVLCLSLTAILLLLPYKIWYYKWLKNIPFTFKELPPVNGVSVLEVMEMQRKRRVIDYLLEESTWVPIVLYLIFPYPGDYNTFTVGQQILYEKKYVCYYFSEAMYAIMFLRLAYLALAFSSFGRFQTVMARSTAEKYGVKITPAFSVKCYIGAYPLLILIFGFLIPGVIIFGLLLRIFERPMMLQDFDSANNAFWSTIITMTTIGYGDAFATSVLGRLMTIFSIFWGGIILSLTFVTVGSVLQLKPNEKRAYNAIVLGREAAYAIGGALVTSKHDKKNKDKWAFIRAKLRAFMAFRNADPSNEAFISHSTRIVNSKLDNLESKAERILNKLEKVMISD